MPTEAQTTEPTTEEAIVKFGLDLIDTAQREGWFDEVGTTGDPQASLEYLQSLAPASVAERMVLTEEGNIAVYGVGGAPSPTAPPPAPDDDAAPGAGAAIAGAVAAAVTGVLGLLGLAALARRR